MRVACVVTDMFEDSEFTEPAEALRQAGHEVVTITPKEGRVRGKHGTVVVSDLPIERAKAGEYDALFIPGGFSPDKLRADERFLRFAAAFEQMQKPIFTLCHGPQLLLTAGLLDGRTLTAWKTVQDDLRRAGIDVRDEEVIVDGKLVTSRGPDDLPAFNRAIIEVLEGRVPQQAEQSQPTLH